MEFKVHFTCGKSGSPVDIDHGESGLAYLDRARAELLLPALLMDLVSGNIPRLWEFPTLTLDEQTARESGQFGSRCQTIVNVPPNSMDSFTIVQTIVNRSDETGEILAVNWMRELVKERVVEAWREAGFPVEWNPADE